jgi:electron transfer flavoprotein alpha subunit
MTSKTNPVWVLAEQVDGKIPDVCFELLGHARSLAGELETQVEAILLGLGIKDQAGALISSGADVVHLGDAPEFQQYQSEIYTTCITSLALEKQPQILLIGSTFIGRELAPLLAANLQTGLTAHCIDLTINEDHLLEQKIPAYGGMMTIICPEKRPQIATVAQGVFPMPSPISDRTGSIIPIDPPEGIERRVRTLEIVTHKPEGEPLETASIVVAGGAGAETIEGWREIEALADALNAALGSTRPAVDYGWVELDKMIGQSGRMVSPDLYIGVGLSGEQQHMVGITSAKVMVAINNDPKAQVFDQVDLGIVEDCREFVPVLVEKLVRRKNSNRKVNGD